MECELYLNIVIILKINNNTLNKKQVAKECTTESYVHVYMHTYTYYA